MSRILFLLALVLFAGSATAIQVTHVYHEPLVFDPEKGEFVTIRFRISEPADVQLHIYDGRDLRIRTVASANRLDRGEHLLAWDGRDGANRLAPPEAYHYTVEAQGESGTAIWDLRDTTGGLRIDPHDLKWDPEIGRFRYHLAAPARVRIRVGLGEGGPALGTIIDWVARAAGPQEEPWDGFDNAGLFNLRAHPNLEYYGHAFTLSRNTVLLGASPMEVHLIETQDLSNTPVARPGKRRKRKRMMDFSQQPIETRRDFPLELAWPAGLSRNSDGLPLVRGPVPVQLSVSDANLPRILNQRCEAVFFLDGQFLFEDEAGFLPMTWTWNPEGVNPGVHYLTVNLRGYEGHFGIHTEKVFVER